MESELTALVSDTHFDSHHQPTWGAFRQWCADLRPKRIVIAGDLFSLEALANFAPDLDEHNPFVIPQIQLGVREINALQKVAAANVYLVPGNHDEWWERYVLGRVPHALRGAIGLSLREQCYAQGLDPSVQWVTETTDTRGVWIGDDNGRVLIRHGHWQSRSKFGGPIHIAAYRLARNNGHNEAIGHHHRAQIMWKTALDTQRFVMALPGMQRDMNYCRDGDMQRGFGVLEHYEDGRRVTPHLVVADPCGSLAWGGKVYGG